ncbi:MAG: ComEC/Rec2 family competence protein [Dehalococcoidales bacterium]
MKKSLIVVFMSLLLILNISASCIPTQPPVSLTVHFIDVGQGDSILIDLGETEVLIDGGSKGTGAANYIGAYVDGPLETIVVTHPHEDHIGGLPAVFDAFEVQEVWLNGETATSKAYTDLMNAINTEGSIVHEAKRGMSIQVGTLVFSVLNPETPLTDDVNNNSIVLRLSYGETDFLFMGDAQKKAESSMLSLLTSTEILKVGHHGSDTSSSTVFLNVIKPETAIISVAKVNSYHHPAQVTLNDLTAIGATIYKTSDSGTIKITTDGNTYTVQTEK